MAKPIPKIYDDIIAEYQTGLYSVDFLAKKYKVKRGTLASFISKNKIEISNSIKDGITAIDKGLEKIKATKETALSNTLATKEKEQIKSALNKGFEYLESKHGEIATLTVKLVTKGLAISNEMLDNAKDSQDLLNTMKSIKTGADTLGLFPKSPLVAIQQNISKEINQSLQTDNIQIEVNFISDKKQDDDIIEAEIKE